MRLRSGSDRWGIIDGPDMVRVGDVGGYRGLRVGPGLCLVGGMAQALRG